MNYELWYSLVVRDKRGRIVSRERHKSDSFLKAWNQLIHAQVSQSSLTIKDTDGVDRSVGQHANNFLMNAAAAVTTYGIRIGTGTTPVVLADYAVETPIAEGTGAGQMNHQASTVATAVVSPPNCSFLAQRVIINNSGSTITVRGGGIYARMSVSYYGCLTRDVFATPQDVPHEGSITIDWTIQVTA
ncbi:hypothetical protein ES703_105484 [subsurface metagenome]